jgi:hypothetical protein
MIYARRAALRRVVVVPFLGVALVVSVVEGMRSGSGPATGRVLEEARLAAAAPTAPPLRLFYTPPVLVRAGEQVDIPVDVVCRTDEGDACPADVAVGTQVGAESWHSRSARSSGEAPAVFDLTAAASRASMRGGMVRFFLKGTDGAGTVTSLGGDGTSEATSVGGDGADAALRFYVASRMPAVTMPEIPFGETRTGEQVLSLPWGSGSMRAGLELGDESDTIGPTSFDVDANGDTYLLDALQQRVAVFADGRLRRQVDLPAGVHVDVGASEDGTSYVLSRSDHSMAVRRVTASGSVEAESSLGQALDGHLAVVEGEPFADLLPLDAWVSVPSPGGSISSPPPIRIGRPMSSRTELLRIARPDSIRIAELSDGRVEDAVEIRSSLSLGEVELADSDGTGGYWVVVHVWRDEPAADQYEVVHARGGAILDAFAVDSGQFAAVPPLNRFRVSGSFLYQMTSSSEGMQIVRYRLGEES